jgi:hypothetical protein
VDAVISTDRTTLAVVRRARAAIDAAIWTLRSVAWLLVDFSITVGWPATGSAQQPVRPERPLRPRLKREIKTGIEQFEALLHQVAASAR